MLPEGWFDVNGMFRRPGEKKSMMTPRETELYQSLAAIRRRLGNTGDDSLSADELRALVLRCVDAIEILSHAARDLEMLVRTGGAPHRRSPDERV